MAGKRYKPGGFTGFLILLAAILLALFVTRVPVFKSLESGFLDYRFRLRGTLDVSESPIVILAIDDQSDESTPYRWPWPREYFAHVIRNLNRAGARVIGVDVIFDQTDIHGATSDEKLVQVLRECDNVVLAGKIFRSTGRFESTILVPPHHRFTESGASWGLVSSEIDDDGIYRRHLVTQKHLDVFYLSFVMQVLKKYKHYDSDLVVRDLPDRFIFGDTVIPKYDSHSMLINFSGPPYTFPVYSFDNVLDDSGFDLIDTFDLNVFDDPGDPELGIPPGLLYSGILKDKIVLIGATMQELHDDFATPFMVVTNVDGSTRKALMPGVEVHANALQTILTGNYIKELEYPKQLVLLLCVGLLVYILSYYLPLVWGAIASLLTAAGFAAVGIFVFSEHNLIIGITGPMLAILFSFMGQNLYRYILTQKEKRMIRGAFSQYVPEKVVAEILKNPDMLQLGGEERTVTVLFSDIAGFTTLSENLPPADLVMLLNEYLTEMSDIILANNGIIDKYEGDAIMAEFGMPVPLEDHAFMACRAALQMQNRLTILQKKWRSEDRPELFTRIGINSGEVIVGNMGSKNVFDYTVIGDPVNLGARLEGVNKFYGSKILISEFTHEPIKDRLITRMLDIVRVKGKEKPVRIYEVLAFPDADRVDDLCRLVVAFEKGTGLYRSRKWNEAIASFRYCLDSFGNDSPSRLYLERCGNFLKNPPPKDWDGVHVMFEK